MVFFLCIDMYTYGKCIYKGEREKNIINEKQKKNLYKGKQSEKGEILI
jgi:hypothetical protein